ncbi:MAG: MFS transporter [Gammaproteobacteria bacterium]|nr:MFS transporter [Gammaproteobacteria bacterium]
MSESDSVAAARAAMPPATRRELVAWAFFDFANSGYTTVVLTTVYSAYFVAVVAAGVEARSPGSATLLWTLSTATANLIVLFSGPVVGAIADQHGCKKPFLLVTAVTCVAGTALLAIAGPDYLYLAMFLLVLSTVAFASGENLIAAFLPEIATRQNMGKVSGYGWSFGYLGGLFTLGMCLAYVSFAESRGLPATHYVPVTLLLTAVTFAVTATPTFLWLRERAIARPVAVRKSYLRMGLAQVANTLRHAAQLPDLFRFLVCLLFFQAGVSTVIVVAAIYAQQVMGFSSSQLIGVVMVVNLTAALGAFTFGYAQDRWGSIPCLAAALLLWIIAISMTLLGSAPWLFWLASNLIGLAMGATLAGGRALIGRMTPAARNAEVFGLWGLANRAAAIIGPISYGAITNLSGGNYQLALMSTLAFFVVGLFLLLFVNEQRGVDAAAAAAPVA